MKETWRVVGAFRSIGANFDTRLTWAEHIEKVVGKSKVLNVMRCLTGRGGRQEGTEERRLFLQD